MKKQGTGWDKHLQNTYLTMNLYPEFPNLNNKKTKELVKMEKHLNRHFINEDTSMVNKHMKKCSTFLPMREMQVKFIIYHYTLTKLAKM